jgi:site-specific DNA-cytosine methylase
MPKVDQDDLHWRALTPLECERLQTVPDLYTQYGEFDHKYGYLGEVKPISNSQRYKMLGNGFTVDVIAHILKGVDA